MVALLKSVTLVVVIAMLLCPAAWTQELNPTAQRPDFTGKWQEDLHASRRAGGRDLTDVYTLHVMTLQQRDTELHISLDIRVPDPKNNRVITYGVQTDGRVYEIDLGDTKALAYAKWEGTSLTTYLKRRMTDGVVLEVLRTMTLGKGGRKLTAIMTSWRNGRLTNSVKEIWERQ